MRTIRKTACLATMLLSMPYAASAQSVTLDQQILLQLQETIKQQQLQLQQQSEQIKAQSEVLQKLQQQVSTMQQKPVPLPVESQTPVLLQAVNPPPPAPVVSGNDKIKLAISGQINRAVNVINDGGNTKLYHVDNDASNTRVKFVGTGIINDDLTLGAKLEVSLTADESSQVSQLNQAPGNFLSTRWAEVTLESKKLGKISLGKGDTASNNSASVDLSRTDVILYSSISDIAGGMFFRQKNGLLTSTNVATAFNSLDGQSRQSRLRYDSPTLFGFSLAGSLISQQCSDIALFWGGEGYGFEAGGAFGAGNPKIANSGLQYDGSFSLLHKDTGLNLSLSGAMLESKTGKDAINLYGKLGWIANLTRLGYTAFGVDYTRTDNMSGSGDRGYSVGAAVVQSFEKIATEVYLQYRIYSLKMAASNNPEPLNDINMGTFGVRVQF